MRGLTRRNLIYYLDIVDIKTGNKLGKIADISLNGLLVLSEEAIESGFSGSIGVVYPLENFLSEPFPPMEAEIKWQRTEKKTGLIYYGMEITNTSVELEKMIAMLIGKIGFSDGEKKARRGLFSQDFY
ncbi:MAG: PilZ domain-containing protein [Spirochaetales bacterium]|nr:PilZ domain-containing protein [Spirochaetales bacterium]